jgi:hypothetical protein
VLVDETDRDTDVHLLNLDALPQVGVEGVREAFSCGRVWKETKKQGKPNEVNGPSQEHVASVDRYLREHHYSLNVIDTVEDDSSRSMTPCHGACISNCQRYAELQHSFDMPGAHILTTQCEASGNPITAKIKFVVSPAW